ncbi:MAG: nucleoside recognition protein [Peptococcaceae bacterium]|nr:nucleoside recognition protein [Peptococcaceae bacterium]
MDVAAFLKEAFWGSLSGVWTMAAVVIPVMLAMELARDLNILDRLAALLAPFLKLFRIPREGAFPLVVGLFLGLAYGAGVIISAAREGRLAWRDLLLINVFLIICHSVVEDTALFMALGADGPAILASRLLLAAAVTFALSRAVKPEGPAPAPGETAPDPGKKERAG